MRRSRIGLLAGILFITVLFLSAPAGGAAPDPLDNGTSAVSVQSGESVTIAGDLQESDGEVRLLVRFGEADAASVEALQTHANRSQANFLRFAEQTDGVTVENRFWIANVASVTVDTERVPLESLARVEGVSRVTGTVEVTAASGVATAPDVTDSSVQSTAMQSTIDTTSTGTTYGLAQINAATAWDDYNARGAGVRVAVLDTGVDASHSDIDLADWAEFDSAGDPVDSEPQDYDDQGHGTHVSGTVAGGDASGTHIGVAPEAELLHAAVLTDCESPCSGTSEQVFAGMEWAVENDADVMSLSLGGEGYFDEFIEPIRNAEANGVTVVAASGNVESGSSTSPGNVYDAFSIGATDANEDVAWFSGGEVIDTEDAWGSDAPDDWPDEYVVPNVVAPGDSIESATPGDDYDLFSGTSMAAPHVAGALAVVQSGTDEHHSSGELRDALEATAWKPDDWDEPSDEPDARYGYGIVDVYAATTELRGETAEPDLALVDATLDPTTILEGESTTVTGTVENSGTATGTFTAGLRVDGVVESIESVSVGPSETEQVTFAPTFDQRGSYELAVNDTHAGTLTVEKPATFEVGEVTVDPTTVEVGESVTVTADVENVGDREGTFTAELGVDGAVVETRDVTVGAGEVETVSFERSFEEAGEYDLTVDGIAAGTVVVEEPAAFKLENVTLDRETIEVGESVTVTADVENVGGSTGTFVGALSVDGETVQTKSVSVESGETAEIAFLQPFEEVGEYTLAVNGTEAGVVTVEEATVFAVANATIDPGQILEGESVTVTAEIENVGEETAEFPGDLRLDGEQVAAQPVTLEPGETETLSYSHTVAEYGEYAVAINRTGIGTLQVDRPATFEVRDLAVGENPAQVGEELTVTATVENVGDRAGRFQGVLEADGTEIGTHSRFLLSGVSRTLSFDVTFDAPGEYTLAVHDAESVVVTVEGGEDPVASYRDGDGVVQTDGLRDAIDDWRNDKIDTSLLRDVIAAWRAG